MPKAFGKANSPLEIGGCHEAEEAFLELVSAAVFNLRLKRN